LQYLPHATRAPGGVETPAVAGRGIPARVPQTGRNVNHWWWWLVACLSTGFVIVLTRKRNTTLCEGHGQLLDCALCATTGEEVNSAREEEDPEMFAMCQQVYAYIENLEQARDMTYRELRLIIGIEDPEVKKAREEMFIETESGVSRDEMLEALDDVKNGRFPKDRLALEKLLEELQTWYEENA